MRVAMFLDDESHIRKVLVKAYQYSTLQKHIVGYLNPRSHKFDPQGVTAVALLAESHISIHTWPENGYGSL